MEDGAMSHMLQSCRYIFLWWYDDDSIFIVFNVLCLRSEIKILCQAIYFCVRSSLRSKSDSTFSELQGRQWQLQYVVPRQ